MATSSTDGSRPDSGSGSAGQSADARSNGGLSSVADKLDTAATVIWASFLAVVVLFTLVPVVGLWFGFAPFEPTETTPYFAFVGLTLVGTVALVAAEVFDV